MATPTGLEPATNSLEGAWSRNDFNARADIFTFRAPFDAIAEFRFVGMPDALPAADGLRTSSLLGGTVPQTYRCRPRRPDTSYPRNVHRGWSLSGAFAVKNLQVGRVIIA
jgi:hypothetical protein